MRDIRYLKNILVAPFRSVTTLLSICAACFLLSAELKADQQLITNNSQREHYSLRSTVTRSGPQYSFQITAPEINVSRVFPLKQPSRIVIDIKDQVPISRSQLDLMGNAYVKNIRIGKYQGKTRYVLDLKTKVVPSFEWSQTKDAFRLVLNSQGSTPLTPVVPPEARAKLRPQLPPPSKVMEKRPPKAAAPLMRKQKQVFTGGTQPEEITLALLDRPNESKRATIVKPSAPLAANIPDRVEREIAVRNAPIVEREIEESVEPPQSITSQPVVPQGQVLSGIAFDRADSGPMIRLSLSQEPGYTLRKSGAREFLLKINNATVAKKSLLLPQFPPQDFEGFTMVMAENAGPNLHVYVGVERDKRLSVVRKHSSLEIKIRE